MSCSPCACIFGATCIRFISSLASSCIGHSSCNVVHSVAKAREPMASSFSSSVDSRLRPGIQAGSQQRGISNIPFPSILTCGLDLAASEKQGWSIPGGTKLPFGPLSFRLRNSINIANMWSQGIVPVRKRLPNASAQYLVLKAK